MIFVSRVDHAHIPQIYFKKLVVHTFTASTTYFQGQQVTFCQNPEIYLDTSTGKERGIILSLIILVDYYKVLMI